ncbi:2-hydroxychromene-2-carboxylate isomerase [Parasphingopyxis sp. CP4]|uniref:2-hydroxychromene-2-carboxylate isomerase n=1 Tax=Parasphingopyxis sp. CP4 TaxID=2724527 RepID=UPI0015A4D4F9|nr:DsbA family protein [Parasphingopyxis sp. CP4]QLC22277.1 2-hydroxychromene-2-carboxylate isomerase [Parasphingopyxis sp. CP4]
MSETIDVFWSFRSPYSYLVTPDLLKLRADYDVAVVLRPVLPIALRAKQSIFDASDKKRPQYIVMDSMRRAQFLGLPFTWPQPDPVVQDMATFEVPEEQPYIWRLSSLGVEAERRGRGIDFAYHVSTLIWGGTRGWDQGELLAEATADAGLDLADLEAAIAGYDVRAEIERNHEMLEAAHHWGVPTMAFKGEPFFGQDRIDTLRWRLDQAGLQKN